VSDLSWVEAANAQRLRVKVDQILAWKQAADLPISAAPLKRLYKMPLQTTLGSPPVARPPLHRDGTKHIRLNTALQRAIGLLSRWRERMRSRRELVRLCRLDDHVLKDIGGTLSELLYKAKDPFWH
jgi:uncharacterized protein YjiS (DUF1127 family)